MSESGVLNPALYAAMAGRFGAVRVINRGRPLEGYYAEDAFRGGCRLRIVRRGETYLADCPHCGDARGRLAVNHRCGVHDPNVSSRDGRFGWENWELWKCYNEECQHDKSNRSDMRHWLAAPWLGVRFRVPAVSPVSRPTLEHVDFPGLCVRLDDAEVIGPDHPAAAYLRGRRPGFDPAALARDWGVGYAVSVPARSRGAMSQDRIIIPVRRDGVDVGWQARYVGDIDWKETGVPKYLTYFPKSLTLYGIDESDGASVVALFEGVSDVWRYGYGGVCGLGKTLSADQAELLAARLRGRPLVLVPDQDDPDSEVNFYKSAAAVVGAGHAGLVAVAPLPKGKDPADLDTPTLRRMVTEAVKAAEVGCQS